MRYRSNPYGTVDGGRARIGDSLAEAVLVLPASGGEYLAIPRRDVILFFGVVGRQTPVYDRHGAEIGYGVWERGVFQVYAGDIHLMIPARDLRRAVLSLPRPGTAYRKAA